MDLLQTLIISVIQGITELFPISSVAHAVLTPFAFGWDLSPEFLKEHFLPFVVMLHLGTAVALLGFFWRDWLDFIKSLFDSRAVAARRTLFLLVVGTIPAAVIGLVFEKLLKGVFSVALYAACFLILNGVLLYVGEKLQKRGTRQVEELSYGQALLIGLAQSLALIPGFSRSGASMVAGFWAGLTHEAAARFSFLLAAPIILGASILEVPKLAHAPDGTMGNAVIGGVVSGIVAFFSVWALMVWFRKHEVNAMRPFAIYCWIVGALVVIMVKVFNVG